MATDVVGATGPPDDPALNQLDPVKGTPALVVLSDDARRSELDSGNDIALKWTDANGTPRSGRVRAEQTLSDPHGDAQLLVCLAHAVGSAVRDDRNLRVEQVQQVYRAA